MGINEVTKYLEAAAAEQVSKNAQADPEKSGASGSALGSDSLCRSDSASGNSVDPKVADAASTPGSRSCAIVLICRDVRPARLVEHLHSLVALTGGCAMCRRCTLMADKARSAKHSGTVTL